MKGTRETISEIEPIRLDGNQPLKERKRSVGREAVNLLGSLDESQAGPCKCVHHAISQPCGCAFNCAY